MSRRRVFAPPLLLLALLLGGTLPTQRASAQQPPEALPQDPLQMATEVGRYLFAYDQAASRAVTMLLSEGGDASTVEATVARQHRDGHWTVGFGRLTDGGGFELLHEVIMNEERLVDDVRQNMDRRLPPAHHYARAARAQRLVRADVTEEHAPYNLLVLPLGAEAGHLTVYALPAQTNTDAYRLGGDFRYEVDPAAGEVVSQTPLHEGYYEVGALPQEAAGSAHEAVRPVATDVLFATLRRPKAPHFVMTGQQVFRIAPTGEITSVPASRFEQREDVAMVSGL